ncbi:hypothetical protein F5Y05DRAFT_20096 [Hypoxylon sp. FL0543]|nr:hypothetical protein F5Y05DRAFT_20096 [Hypoxylon sp. FL0543]
MFRMFEVTCSILLLWISTLVTFNIVGCAARTPSTAHVATNRSLRRTIDQGEEKRVDYLSSRMLSNVILIMRKLYMSCHIIALRCDFPNKPISYLGTYPPIPPQMKDSTIPKATSESSSLDTGGFQKGSTACHVALMRPSSYKVKLSVRQCTATALARLWHTIPYFSTSPFSFEFAFHSLVRLIDFRTDEKMSQPRMEW